VSSPGLLPAALALRDCGIPHQKVAEEVNTSWVSCGTEGAYCNSLEPGHNRQFGISYSFRMRRSKSCASETASSLSRCIRSEQQPCVQVKTAFVWLGMWFEVGNPQMPKD